MYSKLEPIPLLEQQRMRNNNSDAQKVQKMPHHEVLQLGNASRLDHDGSGARGEEAKDRHEQDDSGC